MRKILGGWGRVYALVKRIPRGRVITYGQLAKMLRLPGGARTAGFAIAACPSGRGIPWHRVVGAGGRLLTQEPVASLQRRLLEGEGTRFDGRRVDIVSHQWAKALRGAPGKQKTKRRS
ncbi:MAG TPA: MGMT family protein [Candidatus Acidoferrales bacterium]|nr:MGMT family protein [Candidatus Acidoferrales bacterium]